MEQYNGAIIIINDEDEDIEPLAVLLSDNGFTVNSFRYSVNICAQLTYDLPDCIIIDSEKNTEICLEIKSDSRLAGIPVIFVNGVYNLGNITSIYNAGCTDYITKPFIKEEIYSRIISHLSLKKLRQQIEKSDNERISELKVANALLVETIEGYKKVLKDLQENETLMLTIALNIPNSYLAIIEKDYTIGFASGQEFKKNGIDPWKFVGLPINKVFKEQTDIVMEFFSAAFTGKESTFELYFNDQYQLYRTVPLAGSSGEILRILIVIENITDRKESEKRMMESLKEKEILLKEIHHRVKNNLQIISSLLNLQIGYNSSPELVSIVKSLQNRILSISLVHEKLYHYKQFSKINFREYIKELTSEVQKSSGFDKSECGAAVRLDVDNVYLSIEKAIPLGLILNELIMNSFKHAFKYKSGGEIDIAFKKDENCRFVLTVKDNGKGLPENFDIMNTDSMGMVLIRELVGQIHGILSVEADAGAEFKIVFSNSSESQNPGIRGKGKPGVRGILIVEDERIISTMLRKIIEEQGYSVIACVSSGKEAISIALETKPDLILMDIVLEDEIDGVEAAKIISGEIDVPIVFLTGNSDTLTLNAAKNIKPFSMLTKPVGKAFLMEVINSAINNLAV